MVDEILFPKANHKRYSSYLNLFGIPWNEEKSKTFENDQLWSQNGKLLNYKINYSIICFELDSEKRNKWQNCSIHCHQSHSNCRDAAMSSNFLHYLLCLCSNICAQHFARQICQSNCIFTLIKYTNIQNCVHLVLHNNFLSANASQILQTL